MTLAPRSLLARILWWHGAAVVVTAIAVSAGVYLFLGATADHLERQTLRSQVVALRGVIIVDPAGRFVIPASGGSGNPLAAAGMSFAILDDQGRSLATPSTVTPVAGTRIPRMAAEAYFTRPSRRSVYAGLSVPAVIAGRPIWIVAIQNLDHPANVVDDIVGQFLLHGISIILPLLLLLLGVDALIVRRALRPVRRASALVRTIDPSRLDIRVTDPAIPTEVRPLAEAVDAALDRLIDSLRMQRDFTADAAHELRTPITVARVRAADIADPELRAALTGDLTISAGSSAICSISPNWIRSTG